jgi:hypothetical protein
LDLARTEHDNVRYLPVISTRLPDDGTLYEFSVHCPRRGKICLTECMDCAHAGRLRHRGRRGPLVLECTLEGHFRGGRS